ncbi:hypothetical protein MKX01_032706 [Papaver californicum]|nr:hypothetical protein MKX01_032706 [Papaver californicum]
METIVGSLSVGSLRFASTNVQVQLCIRFVIPVDSKRCIEGMRVIGTTDFGYVGVGSGLPAMQSDDGLVEDFCKRTVNTIWHYYHDGCPKVVDSEFHLIGVDRFRIHDGSMFSISPGTNPLATLKMIGRYGGVKIMEERNGSAEVVDSEFHVIGVDGHIYVVGVKILEERNGRGATI